jgi:hypothetical protein
LIVGFLLTFDRIDGDIFFQLRILLLNEVLPVAIELGCEVIGDVRQNSIEICHFGSFGFW